MASTHTLRTIITAATSNAAGATTTGTVWDNTTKYGGLVTIKLTNGGTGPTVAANAYVYTSADNSAFKLYTKLIGDVTASSVNEWSIEVPAGAMYIRVDVKDNTVQAVTCEAFAQELTTV